MEKGTGHIVHHKAERDKPDSVANDTGNDPSIQARFAAYDSPFFKLLAPMLTTRYLWLAVEDINPKNFLKKPDPSLKPNFTRWVKPKPLEYVSRNFAALGIGGSVLAIMGYYTERTNHDIKTLYSEAVGYELDKKPQDVTLADIYLHSKNEALKVTREAFAKRTAARFASAASFLVPWHVFRDFRHSTPKYDSNASMGVGIVGAYITNEAFTRKPSFFDAEQSLAATAIRHAINSSDPNIHRILHPDNIQTLLLLQKKHLDKHYQWPAFASEEGQQAEALSKRVADLMNQTYRNTPKKEDAQFTIGKFNYLVGFKLLDKFPESLAFVELANKSNDMKEVKAAASAIQNGQDAQAVFKAYDIDLAALNKAAAIHPEVSAEPPARKFTEMVSQAKDKMPQAQRTHQEFAAMDTSNQHLLH